MDMASAVVTYENWIAVQELHYKCELKKNLISRQNNIALVEPKDIFALPLQKKSIFSKSGKPIT